MGFASLSFLVLVVAAFVLYWAQRSVAWQNIVLVLDLEGQQLNTRSQLVFVREDLTTSAACPSRSYDA